MGVFFVKNIQQNNFVYSAKGALVSISQKLVKYLFYYDMSHPSVPKITESYGALLLFKILFCAPVCIFVCVTPKNLFFSKEDLSDNEEMFPKEITKWSSNDLMDKIETPECDDVQGNFLLNQNCMCYFTVFPSNCYSHILTKVKLVILISQKEKLRQSIKMPAQCCWKRIAQLELGWIALDSLLLSVLVRLLCATARIHSYNDEIFCLEFLLTFLSSCSILCSCLYLPWVYFLLIVTTFGKEGSSSGA